MSNTDIAGKSDTNRKRRRESTDEVVDEVADEFVLIITYGEEDLEYYIYLVPTTERRLKYEVFEQMTTQIGMSFFDMKVKGTGEPDEHECDAGVSNILETMEGFSDYRLPEINGKTSPLLETGQKIVQVYQFRSYG